MYTQHHSTVLILQKRVKQKDIWWCPIFVIHQFWYLKFLRNPKCDNYSTEIILSQSLKEKIIIFLKRLLNSKSAMPIKISNASRIAYAAVRFKLKHQYSPPEQLQTEKKNWGTVSPKIHASREGRKTGKKESRKEMHHGSVENKQCWLRRQNGAP